MDGGQAKSSNLSAASAAPAAGTPGAAVLHVLLIEDNSPDARLIAEMLSEGGQDGVELERVDCLKAGLQRLTADGIDLVLLDLSLPDSQGLETSARLHAAAPQVPMIVLSGLADEALAVEAVHGGAQDYLVKGQVTGPLLVRAIRYAIERQRTAAQLTRYTEELRLKNAQFQADLDLAREIQEIFMPQHYPVIPTTVPSEESALRFCHRYLPAAAVGGDFFSVFPISETSAAVFLCDVVGHGMRAALVTAIMRGLVEELKPAAASPGRFMTELNQSLLAILRRTDEPLLTTACALVVDVDRSEVRFAVAGHPSPLRVHRATGAVETLKAYDPRHGPALGVFADAVFPTGRAPAARDDLFLLYTDGLYEVNGPDESEFGFERFLTAVRQRAALPTARLLDEVLAEVQGYAARHEFEDDVCLLGVDFAGLPEGTNA